MNEPKIESGEDKSAPETTGGKCPYCDDGIAGRHALSNGSPCLSCHGTGQAPEQKPEPRKEGDDSCPEVQPLAAGETFGLIKCKIVTFPDGDQPGCVHAHKGDKVKIIRPFVEHDLYALVQSNDGAQFLVLREEIDCIQSQPSAPAESSEEVNKKIRERMATYTPAQRAELDARLNKHFSSEDAENVFMEYWRARAIRPNKKDFLAGRATLQAENEKLRQELENERRISKTTDELARSLSEGCKSLRQQLDAKDAACGELLGALRDILEEMIGTLEEQKARLKARAIIDSTSAGSGWRSKEEWERRGKVLRELVERLLFIHNDPIYKSVWTSAHIHNGQYTGPQYGKQLEAARKELEDNQ